MPSGLHIFPIKSGQVEAARAFANVCAGKRRSEFVASEQRMGITCEQWYVRHVSNVDLLVSHFEGEDLDASATTFVASNDPFDLWFKEQFQAITGIDLNTDRQQERRAEVLLEYKEPALARIVK